MSPPRRAVSEVATWRLVLVTLLALVLPGWWIHRGGAVLPGVAAAVVGVAMTGGGAWWMRRNLGRPTHETHPWGGVATAMAVAGLLVPTIVATGWLPASLRNRRGDDLEIETMLGRVGMAAGFAAFFALTMVYGTSPKRGHGRFQRYLARKWKHGLCPECGMARHRVEPTCAHCGAPHEDNGPLATNPEP